MARGSSIILDAFAQTGLDKMNDTKKIMAAVAVVLILIIALGFGIHQNMQVLAARPGTTTQEARKAIETHDLDKFNKHVNTERLLEQAAEQILTAQINSSLTPANYSTGELQDRYENQLKPDFLNSARAALDEYVATGQVTFPANLTEAQKFFKKSGVTSCEIKSVSKPHLEGHVQYSTAIFYNPSMNFSFELELELTDTEDGWRITNAKGFDDYYNGYQRALRRKLDSLNTPLVHQIDNIFHIKSFTVENSDGDEYGFSQNLTIALKADVKSDKPLAAVRGTVTLVGKDDQESITPFAIDMTEQAQGVQTFKITKTLNPFIKADSHAMKHGLRKKDMQIEITEITFADGSNLKLLDELPD